MRHLIAISIAVLLSSCGTPRYPGNYTAGAPQYTPPIYKPFVPSYTAPIAGGSYAPRTSAGYGSNRYDPNSLANPYGAGSPYKADGLMNPYSQYGSRYSNNSWTNPYATNAPKIYSEDGTYHGRLSTNKYDPDSTSNPYGRYGSRYSSDSLNNPYGAGNPYSNKQYYVAPQP